MRIIFARDRLEVAKEASNKIIRLMRQKFACTLGLATGSSCIDLYRELVSKYEQKIITFENSISFNLDEYVGLNESNPQSFRYFMHDRLFRHVDFCKKSNHFPSLDGNPEEYDYLIERSGGIDLQILGIGRNGHIGFNEPGTDSNSLTHIVQLTEQTRRDNSRFFLSIDSVPQMAITMGIATIMKAREIVLLALGLHKADAVSAMVDGVITPDFPASILQRHQNVTVIVDPKAGSKIRKTTYYT